MRGSPEERFWAKVDKRGEDECWPWTAAIFGNGYGHFYVGEGRYTSAHIFALEIHIGRRLCAGMRSLHSCDNRPCCNPAHLWEGTQKENIADMIAKRRGGLQNGSQRGEKNPRAKITRAQAEEIRSAFGVSQKDLAARYGLTPAVISKIINRVIWR